VTLDAHLVAHDHVGRIEQRVVPMGDLDAVDQVRVERLVQDGRIVGQRLDRVEDDAERLDLDEHLGSRVLGHVRVLGDDHGHRLADVADAVARERRLQRSLAAVGGKQPHRDADVGHVGRREDADDARHRLGAPLADPDDPAVRHVAADEPGVQLAVEIDVGAEAAAAGEEAPVLLARNPPTDVPRGAPGVERVLQRVERRGPASHGVARKHSPRARVLQRG